MDRARPGAAQANRHALDLEVVLERHVEQLHVSREAVLPEERKKRVRDVAAKGLQAALRVEESAGHEHPHEERERGGGRVPLPRDVGPVVGPRERAVAGDDVKPALVHEAGHVGDRVEVERKIGVGEEAARAAARPHSRFQRAEFPKILGEGDDRQVLRARGGETFRGGVRAPVVDGDDLPRESPPGEELVRFGERPLHETRRVEDGQDQGKLGKGSFGHGAGLRRAVTSIEPEFA